VSSTDLLLDIATAAGLFHAGRLRRVQTALRTSRRDAHHQDEQGLEAREGFLAKHLEYDLYSEALLRTTLRKFFGTIFLKAKRKLLRRWRASVLGMNRVLPIRSMRFSPASASKTTSWTGVRYARHEILSNALDDKHWDSRADVPMKAKVMGDLLRPNPRDLSMETPVRFMTSTP
jgi:hypothetical protein